MPESFEKHYSSHLASYFSWLSGGKEKQFETNREFFKKHKIAPKGSGIAVDLGAGSGFQTIPLAETGFFTLAIDKSEKLLEELRSSCGELRIKIACDDIRHFQKYVRQGVELMTCMGDTLTHLHSRKDIEKLFIETFNILEKGGRLILSFRDLTTELKGVDRFIHLRSDRTRIATCFLEYNTDTVNVHDLLYIFDGVEWKLMKSSYIKLKVPPKWATGALKMAGFTLEYESNINGIVTLIGKKGV